MSTTPNQKDLLAKKSDLEGILKPDANDVLHLPDITITLAENGQFYLAGINKKILTLIGNTSGNAVTLDGDAGLTFTTSGGSSTITGITSSSGNSTSLAASQSMVSAKQDALTAGTNITISNNTISATDTNTLSDLTDTTISSLADGQVLKYNAISGKWVNGTGGGGAEVILGTTAPTAAQGSNGNLYIQYDDTNNNTVTHEYVKINGAWEEIAVGGGGGSYLSTIINDGTAVSNVLSLSNPYTDFDELLFTWGYNNNLYITTLKLDTNNININDTITLDDYGSRDIILTVTSTTAFTITSQDSNIYILSIRGLKYSTATKEKQRDVLWTTGTWTMAHPITDYDEIIFKWGSNNSTSFIPSDIMTYQSFIVLDPNTDHLIWFDVTDASAFTVHQDYYLTITSIEGVIYTKDEPTVFAEELTQAEYDALTQEEKENGTIYFIDDDTSTQLIERVSAADTHITSSGHSGWGGEDWGAFDGIPAAVSGITNAWCALEDDTTPWIQYHFDQPYYLTKLVMVVYQHYNASSSAKTVNMNILGSNDGSTWTNIAADGQTKSVTFNYQVKDTVEIELNLGQYEYIRIQGTEAFEVAYNFGCDFDEIYVYGGANPITLTQKIYYMGKCYTNTGGNESNIVIISRTDSTNGYAWLAPCDLNGNPLKPSEVTLLSIFAEADMSGAPPYYNGLNVCVDTDTDRYYCKLYDTQSGNYASDGIYSVDYTVAYIPNSGGSSGGGSSSHTYSTTEQKVGTWIDGSDIYEKSFEVTITETMPIIEQDASYIDALISYDAVVKNTLGYISGVGMDASGWGFALHRNPSMQLLLWGNVSEAIGGKAYVTIRYTKVTQGQN